MKLQNVPEQPRSLRKQAKAAFMTNNEGATGRDFRQAVRAARQNGDLTRRGALKSVRDYNNVFANFSPVEIEDEPWMGLDDFTPNLDTTADNDAINGEAMRQLNSVSDDSISDLYENAVNDIMRGSWGTGHDVRGAKAKALGLDYSKIRQMVNDRIGGTKTIPVAPQKIFNPYGGNKTYEDRLREMQSGRTVNGNESITQTSTTTPNVTIIGYPGSNYNSNFAYALVNAKETTSNGSTATSIPAQTTASQQVNPKTNIKPGGSIWQRLFGQNDYPNRFSKK